MRLIDADNMESELRPVSDKDGTVLPDMQKIMKEWVKRQPTVTSETPFVSPCMLCKFNPPSSGDGKPCCICPAC